MNRLPGPPSQVWRAGTLTYTGAGLAGLLAWLLGGDFALALRDRAIPPLVQLLFKRFDVSDTVAGLLFSSLPALLGLAVAPIVGYQSDRLRTRWGRRIPFLLGTAPVIVAAMAGMAWCVPLGHNIDRMLGTHSPGAAGSALIALGICWVVYEVGFIAASLVFQGLLNDVVPTAVIGRSMALLRAASLAAGVGFNYGLMGFADAYYDRILLGIAAVFGAGFTLMCLKVREGEYPPPPPRAGHGRGLAVGVATYLRDAFGHGYYRLYFATFVLGALAMAPFNLFSLFYARSVGMGMGLYGKCVALTFAVSFVLAYPLGILADRLHPLRLTIASVAVYGLVMAAGPFFVRDGPTFAAALVAHGVFSGVFYTASSSLGQRLLPPERFTEMSSATGILNNLLTIGLAPALGYFLDRTGHAYVHVFHAGFAIALGGVGAGLLLHRRFLRYGGPRDYRPPGADVRRSATGRTSGGA